MKRNIKQSYVADVATRLRITREAFGLEQGQFADQAGIARNAYNQYEQAQRIPRLDIAIKICVTYGVTLDWIFRGEIDGLSFNIAKSLQAKMSKEALPAE